MKPLRSFVTFSRTERLGLTALISFLFLLILIRTCMHYFVHPPDNTAKQQQLVAAWHEYQRQAVAADTTIANAADITTNMDSIATTPKDSPTSAGKINVNTADSAALVSIDGIGPATAHKIIGRRPFTSMEQLLAIPRFPKNKYSAIVAHLSLK